MKTRRSQTSFEGHPQYNKAFRDHKLRIAHGGGLNEGKRKLYRPFSENMALHLTLHSHKARGQWSFLLPKNADIVNRIVYKMSDRFKVSVLQMANSGNHLHMVVYASDKRNFKRFLRSITGLIARKITGHERAKRTTTAAAAAMATNSTAINTSGPGAFRFRPYQRKFWDTLTYSKLVSWGRQLNNTMAYLVRNILEAKGMIRYDRSGRFIFDHRLLRDPAFKKFLATG